MKWRGRRTSTNVSDQRGRRGGFRMGGGGLPIGGRGGLSIGGIVIVVIIALIFGINPLQLLGMDGGGQMASAPVQRGAAPGADPCNVNDISTFTCVVLADTEQIWAEEFAQQGATYREPTLVFYGGRGSSGCGTANRRPAPSTAPPTMASISIRVSSISSRRWRRGRLRRRLCHRARGGTSCANHHRCFR